jgi:2-amino-4-hydroxy-6-hydroxymethyldihydropteridine diphosphokinase
MADCLIAVGGNLSFEDLPSRQIVADAISQLGAAGFDKIISSRYYSSPAFPAGSGPDFINACVRARWPDAGESGARAALGALHAIEARFGRVRRQRWAGRTLDLDLLAVDGMVLPDAQTQDGWRMMPPDRQAAEAPDRLILPHPRLQDRAFVLVPLAEIAPDWRHPRTGRTVRTMRDALPAADLAAVRPLPEGATTPTRKDRL